MQVYILSTTRYFCALCVLVFTGAAFALLRVEEKRVRSLLEAAQVVSLGAFLLLSFLTLQAARGGTLLLFGIIVTAVLIGAILLYRFLYKEANRSLFHTVCFLTGLGIVVLTRLNPATAYRQASFAGLGILVALILPYFRNRFSYLKKPGILYAAAGILMLLIVLIFGTQVNGSNLNLRLFGVTFQLSELVKITFCLYLASALTKMESTRDEILLHVLALAHVGILVLSRDLGTAVIFYVVFFVVFYASTGKKGDLLAGALLGAMGAVVCYLLFRHVQVRVQAFLDPWSVIETMGYQISQSLFALGYGGVFGAGLTKGASSMIPFVETDFIFAAVAEELGILTAVCVILLYLHTFLVIVKLSLDYVDAFAQRFVFGIALTFIFQTFLTIGGEIKFIPSTGVTLPLVSYGGSSLLATYLMFTLVQVVHMLQEERVRGFEERYRMEKQAELEAAYEAKYRARKKAALEAARHKEERRRQEVQNEAARRERADIEQRKVRVTEEDKREVYEETEYNWDADTGEIDLTEFAEVTYDPDE